MTFQWNFHKAQQWAYTIFIFLVMFIFFVKGNMLVPYDGDDWSNLSSMRNAIPMPNGWNPIKILPETLFPITGFFAAYAVNPIIGDYIQSISITSACVLSLIITVYVLLFRRWLVQIWNVSSATSYAFSFLFLLFHFLVFKGKVGANPFLLGSINLTCIFHYLIPALWNASLVLYFWQCRITGTLRFSDNLGKRSFLYIVIYLAIFSNVLSSIILSAYVGACLAKSFIQQRIRTKQAFFAYLNENKFFVIILVVWFISLILEANGGRSRAIGASIAHLPLYETGMEFIKVFKHINKYFAGTFIFVIAVAGIYYYKSKNLLKKKVLCNEMTILLLALLGTGMYLLLVCAKSSAGYIGRSDVIIGLFFWILLLLFSCGAYIVAYWQRIILLLPLLLLFFTVQTIYSSGDTYYAEITMGRIDPEICYQIDKDLINQIITAEQEGKTEMILVVPKGDNRDNWPHPMYMGGNISKTLHRHGIIRYPISIKIQPDTSMNETYHIPIPK